MIAVDTNLLVYAHREESPFYARAREVLEELANGSSRWAIPWPCVHEFLAIVTHPRIFRPPTPMPVAVKAIRAWAESPSLSLIGESHDHLDRLHTLIESGRAGGPMVHDARIVAICLSHGIRQLWSADRDFSRFPSLKTRNPLV